MSLNPLRNIPSVNEILEAAPLRKLVDRISRSAVASTVRTVLEEVRNEVQNAASERTLPSVADLAERIARRVVETESLRLRPVINATGVLLDAEMGPAPLAEEAIQEIAAVARDYANLELDLATDQSSRRAAAVEGLLQELTGAEASLVVNSGAGATLLAITALAAGREVVVSRGELGECDGGCRLSDVIAAGGGVLREVGSTNRTSLSDYASAMSERTALVMRVQPRGYAVAGLTESVGLEAIVQAARPLQVPVLHDLGSGTLFEDASFSMFGEPSAAASLRAGADLVLVSGDRLLGGPECGLLLGRKPLLERIERHPLAPAFRPGKLTLAALGATVRLYRDPEKAKRAVPLLHLLGTSVENLKNRAERLAPQIAAARVVAKAEPLSDVTYLGRDPIPAQQLSTWCIAIEPKGMSVERLAAALRTGTPAVVGRVQPERLLLDLRSVMPRQDQDLVAAVLALDGEKE